MNRRTVIAMLVWAFFPFVAWSRACTSDRTGRRQGWQGRRGRQVARFWSRRGQEEMKAHQSVKTDGDGRFKLECELYSRDQPILAIDSSRKLGGIATIRADAFDKPLSIELSPLVEVRGHFSCTESATRLVGRMFT